MLGSRRRQLARKGATAQALGWYQPDRAVRVMPNKAAWYDVSDLSSMLNNAGAVPSSGDGIKLLSDKSGNSGVNVLCLNGVALNYASSPDSVPVSITGDIDLRVYVALADWTPSASQYFIGKWLTTGVGPNSYLFGVNSSGVLELAWSPTGANTISKTSTVAPTVSDFGGLWVRATLDVDNGATQNEVKFYTSTDSPSSTNPTWVQLGSTVTTAAVTSIFDSTTAINIGAFNTGGNSVVVGNIYRAQIYAGLTGSDLRFDANFATFSKLAASGTESSSNAATVTINTSGATGARISGARDLYQGTAANQPILTIAASGNYLTFDGSNDYLKAAAFSLSQPETVYFVGSQVSWTDQDTFVDGNAVNSMLLFQRTATPGVGVFAGTSLGNVTSMALNANGILAAVYNGASSSIRHNRNAATTGAAGSSNGSGLTIGARADATTAGFANITASEVLVRSVADGTPDQNRFALYAGRKWRIAV